MNNKNTDSFNKMQKEINNINSTFLHGKNKKLVLDSKQLSLKWYEYSVGYAYNTEKGIEFKNMFSGKAEAVKGFII